MFRTTFGIFFLLTAALFTTTGCVSTYPKTELVLVSDDEYYSTVRAFTEKAELYDGFNATLHFNATPLNSKVAAQQLDHTARIFQWNQENYDTEKNKLAGDLEKQTEIFVSFYVPERKHDNLAKKKTLWKSFLDVGGKRYEGKPIRIKAEFSEVYTNYPDHNRWATPYKIVFPVPASAIDHNESKLTITGPVGSGSVNFKSLRQ